MSATADVRQRMGPLEISAYNKDLRTADVFRSRLKGEVSGTVPPPVAEVERAISEPRGLARLRGTVADIADEEHDDAVVIDQNPQPPTPGRIAARLLLARLFDRNPSVLQRFASSTPVVIIDIPDGGFHTRIAHLWQDTLGLDALRFIDASGIKENTSRQRYDAISAIFSEPILTKDRASIDMRAFAAIQLALPLLAITPGAETHLSSVLVEAATDRLTLPSMDADTISDVVHIVTGRSPSFSLSGTECARIGLRELLLAVRFDRSPDECMEMLKGVAAKKTATAGGRDLTLDELHGLDAAVAWARSTKLDLEAWKRGEIGWDALDAGIVLDGPPGTGKTLFAKLASEYLGLPMVSATLAKWQGSGEGHLGHLLRAMKKDFDEARAKAPCVLFIDEIDSFPNRASVTHAHRDYVVEVVNGFIEQVDGVQGRHGLIFVASSNDVRRCDPAIVRSGRFNRVIGVSLPSPTDIEKMLRVRLRDDLRDAAIDGLALLAFGSTGADIERIVKDARRRARQDNRTMTVVDLRTAILGDDTALAPAMLERAALHEAGHAVMNVLHHGPEDVHAVVAGARRSAGFVLSRTNGRDEAGTLADYRRALQILLAGRVAEELELGAAGHGAGGEPASSDLAQATRIAAALAGSFGHIGPHPLLFLAGYSETDVIMGQEYMRRAVYDELAIAETETKRLLTENRHALRSVAEALRTRGRIDGHEVGEIIASMSHARASVKARGAR